MLLGATAQPQQASLSVLLASTVPRGLLWTTPVLLGATARTSQASLPVLLANTVPQGLQWTIHVWLEAIALLRVASLSVLLALGLLLWRPQCVLTVVRACIPLHWVQLQLLRASTVQLALTLWAQELQLHLAVSIVALEPTPLPLQLQLWPRVRAAERALPTQLKTLSAQSALVQTL